MVEAVTRVPVHPVARLEWRIPAVAVADRIRLPAGRAGLALLCLQYSGNEDLHMAHYAEIDTDNRVIRVLVVANEVTHATPDGSEDEALGATFLADLLGGEWVATSYNGNKRGRYAGPGYMLDRERDEFVPPGWSLVDGVWTAPPVEPLLP